MTEHAIETRGLTKEYRGRHGPRAAVRDLDLLVPRGGVHGLLGPNGAGKTTTLRMLMGLARPTRGRMWILGRPVPEQLPGVMDQVGATVGSPRFSPSLTGRQNLMLLARTGARSDPRGRAALGSAGPVDSAVDRVLDRVGLSSRQHDRFRAYSPGMRQRLSIASALLKSPSLVLLDEPTQGLDPAGVRDVRETVRELAESGATVLLCSHLLAEVQQVCDSVSILSEGRLLTTGPVEELVGRDRPTGVWLLATDLEGAHEHLEAAGMRVVPDGAHLYVEGARDPARITEVLADHGIYVRELIPDRPDLEAVFLQITSSDSHEDEGR